MQLIEATRILQEKDPAVRIMLIGDGMEKPRLIENARVMGLNNVIFVESVPKSQINDYINASDVCTAVLKKIDTFKTVYPNKVFDYMAAAKPIIIGIDGVARKLIEDARAGVYAEPENPQAFVESVLALKKNAAEMDRLAKNGQDYVQAQYSREKLAEKYLAILEKIAQKK